MTEKDTNTIAQETILEDFVEKALKEYGSPEKTAEGERVSYVLYEMLKKNKLISKHIRQTFVEVLMAACKLHNLFYDSEDWTTLFQARKVLDPIAKEMGISQQIRDALFQTIEAQLGADTPVPNCRPQPNTPTDNFASAVWIAKELGCLCQAQRQEDAS